ncbi:MAG: uroporphyrinogen decarboxylase family protein [Bacteroidota bacterium]
MIRKSKGIPKPDFENILKVLSNEKPDRPTLFEFFLNEDLYSHLAGEEMGKKPDNLEKLKVLIKAFYKAGYDYATIPSSYTGTMTFPKNEFHELASRSINEGCMISDRESFENYPWPDPQVGNYDIYHQLAPGVPEGMKLIACAPGGVLENIIDIVGYETLCIMSLTDPLLTEEIFNEIGSRLVDYYKIVVTYDSVGALIVNDDWGFKTQTMFDIETMRKHVFPWHKRIVEVIHESGKPAILHSCGYMNDVFDDIINDMKYDGKHSFEDGIMPVEEVITKWGNEIAIMGGIDLDFLARSSPEKIRKRARKLLELTADSGGFALGSGNSIPDYIPFEHYFSMIKTVTDDR